MSVRRLVAAVGLTAVAVAAAVLPAAASYAVGPTDVYVTATGTDNPDCSLASPCASVAAAIFAADTSGTTIHVGAGTFDAALRPGALSKSVSIVGVSPADTILTNSALDGFVVEVDSGTTSLSSLTVHGGFVSSVAVDGGTLVADHVVLDTAACVLAVRSGTAEVTDSTIENAGSFDCNFEPGDPDPMTGVVAVTGGAVSLVRTQVLNPQPRFPGVKVKGGTFTADQSTFDDSARDPDTNNSDGVLVSGGTATVTRSAFHGFGASAVHTTGGNAFVSDDTFQGNVVGVTGDSGSATVVRSTFQNELAALQSTVAIAGSVLGADKLMNCGNATITDLGYNLSTDATCGFTQTTSHENVLGLPGSAVDTIPAGATYGASATPLCAGTDLRGVPRPQTGACDAGSMEMVVTTTTLQAPATAKPRSAVTLEATVDVQDVGIDGIESPTGTVTFSSGGAVLCHDVAVVSGVAQCTTTALAAGSHSLSATFTPADGSTLHGAVSASRTIKVGTVPVFTSKSRTTFVVGRSQTFRVRASGSPSARITLVKGKLPAGLSFHAGNASATISGKAKASAVGRRSVTVQAANLRGTVKQVLRIVVARH